MVPETRYALNGDVSIAWQSLGEGPALVFLPGLISHLDHLWNEPGLARFLERLAGFSRLILFDRRGTGLSDRVTATGLEEEVDDVAAVLDAAGVERCAPFGYTSGGPLAVRFAVDRPERVGALVLYGSIARTMAAPDYDFTHDEAERARTFDESLATWGRGDLVLRAAPSAADDPRLRAWFASLERLSASPGTLWAIIASTATLDVREALAHVAVPTLVLHRRDDQLIDVRHSRYLAEHIPGARLVELEGTDSLPSSGDSRAVLDEIEAFLVGARRARTAGRALRTVLFTDIVDGTAQAARLGDARWRDLLATHDAAIAARLARHDGVRVKGTGDGVLATFAGPPSEAVRCARAIVAELSDAGIPVRAGLHTGECELIADDVGGMAVHIAARVCALAGAGEVLVSGTVFGTVVGSDLPFTDRGSHELKGVPEKWPLFALAR